MVTRVAVHAPFFSREIMTEWKVSAEMIIKAKQDLSEEQKAMAVLAVELQTNNSLPVYIEGAGPIYIRLHIKEEIT
jgi:hypothetical protein